MFSKIKNKLSILITILLFFSACSTVKDAMDPQRKNNSEEFLVEKKSPLSMPPNFNELPVPKQKKSKNQNQNQLEVSIEDLITTTENNEENYNIDTNTNNSLEDDILYRIRNY